MGINQFAMRKAGNKNEQQISTGNLLLRLIEY